LRFYSNSRIIEINPQGIFLLLTLLFSCDSCDLFSLQTSSCTLHNLKSWWVTLNWKLCLYFKCSFFGDSRTKLKWQLKDERMDNWNWARKSNVSTTWRVKPSQMCPLWIIPLIEMAHYGWHTAIVLVEYIPHEHDLIKSINLIKCISDLIRSRLFSSHLTQSERE